jgi:hypothetical protein
MMYHGPLPEGVWVVATLSHHNGLAVQGNASRELAAEVALAASLGWITTVDPNGQAYGRIWRITVAGLTALHNKDLMK